MAKRLIDAEALGYTRVRIFHGLKEDGTPCVGGWNAVVMSSAIRQAPTVDAVEVVRCSQCVNYCFNKRAEYMYCDYWDVDDYHEAIVHEDDFCSYGERRC